MASSPSSKKFGRLALVGLAMALGGALFGYWLLAPDGRERPEPDVADELPRVPGKRAVLPKRGDVVEQGASPRADALAAAPRAGELVGPPQIEPVFHPRDPQEWQGMRINMAYRVPCETTSTCGMGKSCQDGLCGPCQVDGDCLSGEACVLDHCVPSDGVTCRRRADCAGSDELCLLSGYSADVRGNSSMTTSCVSASSGEGRRRAPAGPAAEEAATQPTELDRLFDDLKNEPEAE